MKNKIFNDTRLLDAMDHIDSSLIAETADKIRPPAAPKREAEQPKTKRVVFAWKQAAALVACALVMGAIIPAVSMLVGKISPARSNFGAGSAGSDGASNNLESEKSVSDEETNISTVIFDGSEGLEYVMNPDGQSASFIGFGTCTDEDIVIASTYNGVPVTQMINDKFLSGASDEEAGSVYAKSITVSDTVASIYNGIFETCPNLERIYIGANVNYMRPFVAYTNKGCTPTEIKVSPDNRYFFAKGNCLIETQSKILILAYGEAEIPADGSVTTIGNMAFAYYPYKTIAIPESVDTIESQAFTHSCLESVVLPKNLKSLQTHAFTFCENLKSVDLNGYTEIPIGTFYNANNLTEIIGLENVTVIGEHAFSVCRSISTINLGAGLTEIGQQAFYSCWNLTTINFEGTVEQWNAIKKGPGWNTLMNDPDWHEKIPVEYISCSDGTAKP